MKETEYQEMLEAQLPSGEACLVVLTLHSWITTWKPKRTHTKFPEVALSIDKQRSFMLNLQKAGHNNQLIITTSPFILSDFKKSNVRIYDGRQLYSPKIETYGTCPLILMQEIFNYDTLIGARAMEDLNILTQRIGTETDMQKIKEDSRSLGESTEKALLFYNIINREKFLKGGSKI